MRSVVFFHAHPDDETLLTGGSIALLAAAGWRVTVVVATDGCMNEVPANGAPRLPELGAAVEVLGASSARCLGYADSGKGPILFPDPADRPRFARVPVREAAARLAAILDEVGADVLVHYDPAGGYHHPDHVHTHRVGAKAASLADTPTVLEATVPRELLVRGQRALGRLPAFPYTREQVTGGGTPRRDIDTVVDVRSQITTKVQALRCHTSVVGGNTASGRMTGLLTGLPPRLLGPVIGREYFRTTRGTPPAPLTYSR